MNGNDLLDHLQPATLHWDYDEEADVLYLSVGAPRPAVGIERHARLQVHAQRYALGVGRRQRQAQYSHRKHSTSGFSCDE